MSDLSNILLSVGTSLISSGLLTVYFKERIKAGIAAQVQKEVNSHKQQLDTLTEYIKHDIQKNTIKAQLHTTNLHATYPELYKKLIIAHGAIAGLNNFSWVTNYKEYSPEDIIELLKDRNVLRSTTEDIIETFRHNPDEGDKKLKKLMTDLKISDAQKAHQDMKNYWLINELYLDDRISKAIDGFNKDLAKVWASAISPREPGRRIEQAEERLQSALAEIKKLIQQQLEPLDKQP
jgi:hypothetical protein